MTIEINLNEKRKKGRPKKNLQITLNDSNYKLSTDINTIPEKEDEKKKRGRKKKEIIEDEVKIKKKRGRKAALKYFSSSIRKQIPLKTDIVDNENGILFLDIKDANDNMNNTSLTYDSFDTNGNDNFDTTNKVQFDKNDIDIQQNSSNELYGNESNITDHVCNKFSMNEYGNSSESNDEIMSQKYNIKKGFFKILNQFMDWKEKTDVKCWWCCHNFDTVPLGMPIYYDHTINKFSVRGIFCSFSCMLSYSRHTKGVKSKPYLINYLYKKLTGVIGINFKEAPHKYVLNTFGGHLSIDEFRDLSSESKTYQMIEYPMYMSRDYIAEVDLESIKQVNTRVFNNVSKVIVLDDKKVEDAKYRISKIVNNSISLSNTIEDFIKN